MAIDTLSPLTVAPANVAGVDEITQDALCSRCEYNLRGLTWTARCPECGQQNAMSRLQFNFTAVDPVWVRKLRRGVQWCLAGFCISLVCALLPFDDLNSQSISTIVNAIGALLLTTRSRDPRLNSSGPFWRITLRCCAIADLMILTKLASTALAGLVGNDSLYFWMVISWLVGYVARCNYLLSLSRYVSKAGFQKQMSWQIPAIMVGVPISTTLAFLAVAAGGLGNRSPAVLPVALAGGALALAGVLWYALILLRFAWALRAAEQFSRRAAENPSNWLVGSANDTLAPRTTGVEPTVFGPLAAITLAFAIQLFFAAWHAVVPAEFPLAELFGLLFQIAFWTGALSLAVRAPALTGNRVREIWLVAIFGGVVGAIVRWLTPHMRDSLNTFFYSIDTVTLFLQVGALVGIWVILHQWARSLSNERLITGSRLVIVGHVFVFALTFVVGWLADASPDAILLGYGTRVHVDGMLGQLYWISGAVAGWAWLAIQVGQVVLLIPVLITVSRLGNPGAASQPPSFPA